MITIRSCNTDSDVALISLEATLTTPRGVYTISSNGPMSDSVSRWGGELFGAISWPRSRFHLAEGLSFEQQMLLPNDGSAVALSWELRGGLIPALLVVRPFFSGCGPRFYRNIGFRVEPEEDGGRLAWLPNVRGPKVIADTNGEYHNAPTRFIESSRDQETASASSENLVTPGTFEFELSKRPSVLIFSMEGHANPQRNQHVGAFLAGLMRDDRCLRTDPAAGHRAQMETMVGLIAA